jgi:ubiquinone/menaquinone biosynthesis C-methylase UbiE
MRRVRLFSDTGLMELIYRLVFSRFVLRLVAKYGYPSVTRLFGADEVLFMNWAYEDDPPMALPLAESDEPNRFWIQLYHRTATQADLSSKRVLEVSCGHGGGAAYLLRTLHPTSYTGLDLNRAGIAFCRKTHQLPGLDFVHGDAENLPFADQSFDAVINIEASHNYLEFPRFLAEVTRVLHPGGHFLYADFRPRHRIAEWQAALAEVPMQLLSQEVINAQVLRGMEKISQQNRDLFRRHVPTFLSRLAHRLAREITGTHGSRWYRSMQSGELSYRMCCFAKM